MTSSFWQIPLKEESKKYTAFMFEGRVYEFNVVPFGLKVSTAALVRGLEHLLRKIRLDLMNFVDDYLAVSKSIDKHFKLLELFFIKIREYGMTIKFEKI